MVCTYNLYHITDRADQFSVTSYYGDTTLLKPQQYFLLLTIIKMQKKQLWHSTPRYAKLFLYVFSVHAYAHAVHLFSKSSK